MDYTRQDLELHWRSMVRAANGVLGSRDEAEECAAAAIVQVLERGPHGIHNLEAFMVTVAKRRAVDRLRSLLRSRSRDQRLVAQHGPHIADVADDVVARAEARWVQAEALRRLSPLSYRILEAAANEVDVRVVGEREGMTVRAVQSDLSRSRLLLRRVVTRALAALGVAAALVRRGATVAVPAVTAVLLLGILPGLDGKSEGHDQSIPSQRPLTMPTRTTAFTSPTSRLTRLTHMPPRPLRGAVSYGAVNGRGHGEPQVQEQDAAGRTTVAKGRHGRGGDAGTVGGLLECLTNVNVDPHHLGC
jgi:DNA-directed RNA polymerase specialized sigma24 family protein